MGGMSCAEACDIVNGNGAEAVARSLIVGLIFSQMAVNIQWSINEFISSQRSIVYLRNEL